MVPMTDFEKNYPILAAIDQTVEDLTTGEDAYPMQMVIDALREIAEVCEEFENDPSFDPK
jgi:hypothetical protein